MSKVIVIEGPDGAGKSTIAGMLAARINSEGFSCLNLHSPGATEIGKEIASIIYSGAPSRKAMSFLYMADFAHLNDELKNSNYDYIVMDRHSCFSELVYSGMIDNDDDSDLMHSIYFNYMGCQKPDYSLILNIPYQIACNRIIEASRFNNFLDSKFVEDKAWGIKITERYSKLVKYGCNLADTGYDIKMWTLRTPDDWVEDIYSRLKKADLV